jgi:secreted trypsin-like serine protease
LKPSRSTLFTSVGYGLQQANAAFSTGIRVRMYAEPHLDQINTANTGDQSLLLSANSDTGGTCFGDSGGPNYLGTSNVVAAVTSYAMNGSCGGTAGVFRVDRPEVLAFVRSFLK